MWVALFVVFKKLRMSNGCKTSIFFGRRRSTLRFRAYLRYSHLRTTLWNCERRIGSNLDHSNCIFSTPRYTLLFSFELPDYLRSLEGLYLLIVATSGACSVDYYRRFRGLHCWALERSDLHPKANGFSLPFFITSTTLQSCHVTLLPHPIQPLQERRGGRKRSADECERQTAFKVFPWLFYNSLAVKWVSIARIPALLRSVHGSERWGEDRQWMGLAMGLRYTFNDFTHTRAGEHTRTHKLRWVSSLLCS